MSKTYIKQLRRTFLLLLSCFRYQNAFAMYNKKERLFSKPLLKMIISYFPRTTFPERRQRVQTLIFFGLPSTTT